jgi:hypothetical protein
LVTFLINPYTGIKAEGFTGDSDSKSLTKVNRIKPVRLKAINSFNISIPEREIKSIFNSPVRFERSFDDEINNSFSSHTEELDPLDWGKYRESPNINQDSVAYFAGEAIALLQSVKDEGRLVDQLTEGMTFQLPVGVQKTIGGLSYTVVFHKLKLTETNAYVDAYLVLETSKDTLSFMGRGIEFSAEGGITGVGRLELIGNANITLPGDKALITLLGSDDPATPGPTYAEFDCYGFKELAIDADVTFSKDLFIKENPDGTPSEERLTTNFSTTVTDWNNILVELTLPRFQLKSLEGWSFEVSNAVFDFSDTRNSADIKFPTDYDSPYFIEGTRELWRGFYLRELVVTLPKEFNKKNTTGRTSFRAAEILIDESGFSGSLSARELLTLDEGDADSWKLSVDSLYASFLQNELVSAGLAGQIEIPSMKSEKPLLYSGTILGPNDYQLIAQLQDDAQFDIFKADLNLTADSYIELKVQGGKFKPKAVLNGNMNIAPTSESGKKTAEVKGLLFQQLVLQTEAPYIQAETFGFTNNSENKTGGFPIGINAVELRTDDNRIGIYADVTVNLVKADDSGFGAGAGFTVWAKRESIEGRQIYSYDKIELSKISVDVERPGFSIKGSLTFYEGDNTYGDGFRGDVEAKFASIDVTAVALFGKVNNLRYWYVDALVEWKTGMPMVPPFALNGIGGGAYYHMRQQGLNENLGSNLGKSTSGVIYVPDPNYHLGIKASVTFSIQNAETTANGNAEFSIAFNSSGGVNQVAFNGGVEVMTEAFSSSLGKVQEVASKVSNGEEIERNSSASISGQVNLLFDNTNDTFHGEISMYINAAGGLIKGTNSGGLAGKAVIHFAPSEWYIHIGNPTVPIGIDILSLATLQGYFMVGHNIPPMPPPPQLVLDILTAEQRAENDQIRANSRNLTDQGSGKGFAFGARFTVDTGDKRFLMFYGRFAATAGFDINMQKINKSCSGRSGLVGINGWYAQGQAYFGMLATIGMKINLRFIKKNVEIFHGELAALMQVKGPNPFWMRGDAAGRFSVLNGLVKGKFSFTVTIGDECELENLDGGNPLEDVKVIAQLTPDNGATEVDVFTSPQAVFNIPVEKEFQLEDLNGNTLRYKAEVEYFRLKQGNSVLATDMSFNSRKDVAVLKPVDILPDQKDMKLEISIIFKEYVDGGWQTVEENSTETLSINFKSGPQPDFIPEHMVSYTYPIEGMANFYQDETDRGYIKLNQGGLTRPFDKENGKWNLKASFSTSDGKEFQSDFTYDNNNNQVNFNIPQVAKGEVLHFELLRVPTNQNTSIDANVTRRTDRIQLGEELADRQIDFEVETNQAQGTVENLEKKSIYDFYMRSSKFNTLEEKLFSDYYDRTTGTIDNVSFRVYKLLYSFINGYEVFDELEIRGNNPLIKTEFLSAGNDWIEKDINPILYNHTSRYNLPTNEYIIIQRSAGLTIDQSVGFNQDIYVSQRNVGVQFNVPVAINRHYKNFKNEMALEYVNKEKPDWVETLINSNFPMIRVGGYPTKMIYRLPNGELGKSNIQFNPSRRF